MAEDRQNEPDLDAEVLPVCGPSPGERVEWVKPAEVPGVHVIHIENSRLLLRMFHTTFSMTALYRGKSEWTCNGTRHRSRSGNVIVWEPGDFHRCLRHFGPDEFRGGDATTTQSGMVIQPWALEAFAEESGARPSGLHVRSRNNGDPEIFRTQRAFYRSLQRPSTTLERQSRFADCVRLLLDRVFETRLRPQAGTWENAGVRRAREYIEDRFAEEIRLENLALLARLDRFYFLRIFRGQVGITPHQYQIEVRVSRARQLLDKGVPPAVAAAQVGFADQSHFTRHFKRLWQVTPGEYLRLR